MNPFWRPLPVLLAVGLAVGLFPTRGPADDKTPPKFTKGQLADKLAQKVSLDKTFDGNFGDAVKLLSDKFDLPLVIDPSVKLEDGMAACDGVDDLPVKLPRLLNVRTDTVLRLLCDQMKAMFLVQPDHIKIVTAGWAMYESGILKRIDPNNQEEPELLPLIDALKAQPLIKRALVTGAYKNVPLADVLDDIAESTGATVILSPEVGPTVKTPITVRFANTPVDAAVRTICEITDLGVFADANVLVVTTKEKAAARQKSDDDKRRAKALAVLPSGGPIPAEVAAELLELRKQNEQLRKQLEEIQKMLKK